MKRCSESIELAEQQVAEARTVALAEYQAAGAKLRRRLGSPIFIGGVLLWAIAGYLFFGPGKQKAPFYPGSRGAWSRVGKTLQVLLPLLMARDSATETAHRPRADISVSAG